MNLAKTSTPKVRFTLGEARAAWDEWLFNCGPAALFAILGKTPEEVRPHLLDFEQKGYTNPTLMFRILDGLGINYRRIDVHREEYWPRWGLSRIQWEGPWTQPGVPIKARYRQTHWVGSCYCGSWMIFDVNAMNVGGWINDEAWKTIMVPWILKECVPRASGGWHVTHKIEILDGAL